ncbi:MAG: hypothetical protein R3E42_00360 [Burkholderiaceae bacterium]
MNPSTLIGIVASSLLMAVIVLFGADDPAKFIDLPSIAIVLGGTLAATFLSYPDAGDSAHPAHGGTGLAPGAPGNTTRH